MKTRGGWRETPQAHEIDLAVRNLSSVSDEELMRVIDPKWTSGTRYQPVTRATIARS
jgi:hypothetical protein